MSESILKQRLKACTIDEIERLKLIKDLNINKAILKDYFDSYPILTEKDLNENANAKKINFENYKLLFENGNFDLIKLIFKYNSYDNKAYGDYFGSILEYIIDDYKSNLMPKYDTMLIIMRTIMCIMMPKKKICILFCLPLCLSLRLVC